MAHQYTYSSSGVPGRLIRAAIILIVLIGILQLASSCEERQADKTQVTNVDGKKFNRVQAEAEYRLLQTEVKLAKTDQPYMVLDMKEHELQLRLKDAVIWSYPMNFASEDSSRIQEFTERFRGKNGRLIRRLVGKHLFSASEKTPDSVLAIVGEVVKVDPSQLQRDIPHRFQLLWGDGLILDIRTDVAGKPVSIFENAIVELRQVIAQPFGEVSIVLQVDPTEALTLYRAATPGMATLIEPS